MSELAFVTNIYRKVLLREPDAGGVQYWTNQILLGGVGRDTVTAVFLNGGEFQNVVAPIVRLYENLLGRAPDAGGVEYWAGLLRAGKVSLHDITSGFLKSAEAASLGMAPSVDNAAFVKAMYRTMGRTDAQIEADKAGVDYWVNLLNTYKLDRAGIATMITESPENVVSSAGFVVGYAALRFVGVDAPGTAQLNSFSATASSIEILTAAKTVTDSTTLPTGPGTKPVEGGVAGQTFTLTVGQDSLNGTAGRDQFFGTVGAGASDTTLNPFDKLAGGAGTDTLNVSLSGGDYSGDTTISSIEVFNVRATGGARNFDLNGLDGVTDVWNDRSSSDLTIKGISTATKVVVDRMVSGQKTNVEYKAAALAGEGTDAKVDLRGVAVKDTTSELNLYGAAGTTDGIETVTLGSGGTASFLKKLAVTDTAGGNTTLTKLVFTGSADVTIADELDFVGDEAGGKISTVDASEATGGLSVAFTTGEQVDVKGGKGNDTFTFKDAAGTTANLTTKDKVVGGEGTDTLVIDQSANTSNVTSAELNKLNISGIEVIQYESDDNQDVTLYTDGIQGLNTLKLVENDTTAKNYTVTDLAAGVGVELVSNVNGQKIGAVTLGLKDASGTADKLSVTLRGNDAGTTNQVADLAFTNVEELALTSAGKLTAGTALNTLQDISSDTKLTKITVAGDSDLSVTMGAEATNLATVDASGFGKSLTFDVNALSSKLDIKGGSGKDSFVFGSTLNNDDKVEGGAGEDKLSATINGLTATTGKLNISNVETINLTATANATIDASSITGASKIAVSGANSGNTVTVTNLANAAVLALGLQQTGNDTKYTGTLDVALKDASGSADSITINLENDQNDTVATLKGTGIETLNLAAASDQASLDLTVTDFKASKIVATGGLAGADLDLAGGASTTLSTSTTTVDASAYKGTFKMIGANGVAMTVTGAADTNNITTSTGADKITIDGSAAKDHTINAGTGTAEDTLNIVKAGNIATLANVSNVERFNIDVASSAAVNLTNVAGFNTASTKSITITGGNSLSTFTAAAITTNASALTLVDASGFEGSTTLSFGADALVSTAKEIKGGKGDSDSLTVRYDTGSTTLGLKTSGVETLNLQVDGNGGGTEAYTVDMANVVGAKKVTVINGLTNLTGAETVILNNLAAGIAVEVGTTAKEFGATSSLTANLASNSGTADAQTFKLVNTNDGAATVSLGATGVEKVTLNVDATDGDHKISLANVAPTADSKTEVTITGGKAAAAIDVAAGGSDAGSTLQITSVNADVNKIDASSFLGNLVIDDRGSAAITITGGTGHDILRMENASDVLDGGEGTDTLVIVQNAVLGGFKIDLSATEDQVTTYNGAANAAVQKGFENVDLSKITGSFGADITANKAGSVIIGTVNNDVITLGAGTDTVSFTGGRDTISNFTVGTDQLRFNQLSGINGARGDTVAVAANAAATDLTTGKIIIFADGADGVTTSAITSYTDLTDVATFLAANLIEADGESYVAVVNDVAGENAYAYLISNVQGGSIDSSEVSLIGILSNIGGTALGATSILA